MAWLFDTNVLSELRRPRPEPKVVAFVAGSPLDQVFISVVTLAEIRFGIELVAEPNRRSQLNEWLKHKVRPMFDGRVLQVREDIMLAATAIQHGLTVVTRDRSDYEKARVPVFNPWET